MNFIQKCVEMYARKKTALFFAKIHNPSTYQERIFKNILLESTSTLFGRDHGVTSSDGYVDFTKKVPVRSYEELFPYIEKSLLGEPNVLTKGVVTNFAKSSGTTNARSKFIPLPKKSIQSNHYKGSIDMMSWVITHFSEKPFYLGKNISITGSFSHFVEYPKAKIGDISAHLVCALPFWARLSRGSKLKTSLMDTWDKKRLQIIKDSFSKKVTTLLGAPTWMLHIFDSALDFTKRNSIREVWPHVSVFFHGAVNLEPYKNLFEKKLGDADITYVNVYNASEGFIGFQYAKQKSDEFVLAIDHGIFYECIEASEYRKGFYEATALLNVKKDIEYVLVITTIGGLYRYVIGDTVMFTSLAPFVFKLTGRTKQFLNTFGEEVVVQNIESALSCAVQKTSLIVVSYTITSYFGEGKSTGGHEWLIEFETKPNDAELQEFTKILDLELRNINSDYDAKRYNDLVMGIPKIAIASKDTFIRWLTHKNKLGGQHKIPLLSEKRDTLEEIKKYI